MKDKDREKKKRVARLETPTNVVNPFDKEETPMTKHRKIGPPHEDEGKGEKRLYLTKNRKKALHAALCVDDILYETHRRLMEDLHRQAKRLIHDRMRVFRVVDREKEEVLQIKNVIMTNEGSEIWV